MKEQSSKRNNFIFQAGILAAAGIIVRIIGILYRTPLVMIIGDEGNGYYNTAYNIYTIILLISSYSIPSALSKVIAARLGINEYRNAYRLFIGGLVYVVIMGSIGSAVCYFFADRLVGVNSAQALRMFAPTILLSGLLGTFRGFFQAQRTMAYTSASQIFEQIINAIVSIGAAVIITKSLAGMDDTTIAIGGAKGSAIGTGAGVLAALIFMIIIYIRNRKSIHDKVKNDKTEALIGPKETAGIILGIVTPVIMSTCIYNLSSVTNLKLYQEISMAFRGHSEVMATTTYGLFSGKSMQIVNIPIALAAAMSSAIIPTISHINERGEHDAGREKIAMAIKTTMLIAVPCAVGLFVLSRSVTVLLYPQRVSVELVASMIRVLSITVVFYCLSTLSNGILQGTGHVHAPVINAAIALVVQSIVATVLLFFTDLGIYSICISTIVYSFLMCVLNGYALNKNYHYKQELVRTFFLPACASVWMGLVARGAYAVVGDICKLLGAPSDTELWGVNNVIALIIAIVVAMAMYAVLVVHYGVATEKELLAMPKGATIVRICKKTGLLKEEDIITRRRKARKNK